MFDYSMSNSRFFSWLVHSIHESTANSSSDSRSNSNESGTRRALLGKPFVQFDKHHECRFCWLKGVSDGRCIVLVDDRRYFGRVGKFPVVYDRQNIA